MNLSPLTRWSTFWLKARAVVIPLAMAAVALAVVLWFRVDRSDIRRTFPVTTPGPAEPAPLKAYITGAVQQPGVYTLQNGDRIDDLLRLAGGPSTEADLEAVNLATRLRDAQQVIIPRLGDRAAAAGVLPGGLVNLNTATQAVLESLPDIGKVRARHIIESRTNDGRFREPRDLVTRQIITERIFSGLQDRLTVQ